MARLATSAVTGSTSCIKMDLPVSQTTAHDSLAAEDCASRPGDDVPYAPFVVSGKHNLVCAHRNTNGHAIYTLSYLLSFSMYRACISSPSSRTVMPGVIEFVFWVVLNSTLL